MENVRRGGGCKVARYCSKFCQLSHWEEHEKYCGRIPELIKIENDKLYSCCVNRFSSTGSFRYGDKEEDGEAGWRKADAEVLLFGKLVDVLWDTGSMVSMVDRHWVKENFPDERVF